MRIGFNNDLYLKLQSEGIKERIDMFDSKLYMEFGGKLFDDFHASRVLPGFEPDSKLKILQNLKDDLEIIFCINANDIEKSKVRADYGITYDMEVLRLIKLLQDMQISINSVVITLYKDQTSVEAFKKMLSKKGIKTYIHTPTKGYPTDVDLIVSDDGYGKNEYIETTKKLIVVTAPGPNSGKLATCLSQLYHDYKRGIKAGYAKFETFPVWNLPLKHQINVAYEVATADLRDVNMIDSFHLEAYGTSAINYNRDLETFPILKNILNKIIGEDIYKSPTDMGINVVKSCIVDDEIVKEAAEQEIIRRYYNSLCDVKQEFTSEETTNRIKILMNELNLSSYDRKVANVANDTFNNENRNVIALELKNGKIITGKQTEILSPASSLIINTIKELSNIPDDVYLLSPTVLEPILKLKQKTMYKKSYTLNLQEVLIALSICSATNPIIVQALNKLDELNNCEAHSSYIITDGELNIFKNLKIKLTCEPVFNADNMK